EAAYDDYRSLAGAPARVWAAAPAGQALARYRHGDRGRAAARLVVGAPTRARDLRLPGPGRAALRYAGDQADRRQGHFRPPAPLAGSAGGGLRARSLAICRSWCRSAGAVRRGRAAWHAHGGWPRCQATRAPAARPRRAGTYRRRAPRATPGALATVGGSRGRGRRAHGA